MVSIIRGPRLSGGGRRLSSDGTLIDEVRNVGSIGPMAEPPASEKLSAEPPIDPEVARLTNALSVREVELENARQRVLAVEGRLAAHEEELETLRTEAKLAAHDQGFTEGFAAGEEEARASWGARLESLTSLASTLGSEYRSSVEQAVEDDVVALAYAAVCRIVGSTVVTRDGMAELIRQLVDELNHTDEFRVCVSTDDYEMLRGHDWSTAPEAGRQEFELVADERIQTGGCIVESARGNLDGRLDTQLQALKDALLQARRLV